VARINGIITRLDNLDIPAIVANNGFTRAGGFEISLGCDFIIVADEAKIGNVHTGAGVVPAATGFARAQSALLKTRLVEPFDSFGAIKEVGLRHTADTDDPVSLPARRSSVHLPIGQQTL
jgi:Enoyl-CoA hydratase/isomerase